MSIVCNFKVAHFRGFYKKHQVNIAGLAEVGINWTAFKASQTLSTLFQGDAMEVRGVSSHNKHESAGHSQYGGTGTLAFDEIQSKVTSHGKDQRGLGRWSWIKIAGTPTHCTRIITA